MVRRSRDVEAHPLAVDDFDSDAEESEHRATRRSRETQDTDFPRSLKHPKITGYRALVLTLTSCFGIPKAVFMYRNNSQSGSAVVTSLDLVLGVVCATSLYWLGLYEESHPPWMRRLFNLDPPANRRRTEIWQHPKLTGYRLIVLTLTTVFGISKAVLMYNGQYTAPNILDWQFGVICIIGLFWLGWYETSHPPWMRWMFDDDTAVPRNEKDLQWHHPKLTGYRILVVSITASFGISKAALAWKGKSTEATSADLVFGVFWTSALFWLGLYQNDCPPSLRWFFVKGYFTQLPYMMCSVIAALMTIVFILFFPVSFTYLYIEWSKSNPEGHPFLLALFSVIFCVVMMIMAGVTLSVVGFILWFVLKMFWWLMKPFLRHLGMKIN